MISIKENFMKWVLKELNCQILSLEICYLILEENKVKKGTYGPLERRIRIYGKYYNCSY